MYIIIWDLYQKSIKSIYKHVCCVNWLFILFIGEGWGFQGVDKYKGESYLEACLWKFQNFSPFVLSVYGQLILEEESMLKRLASSLTYKWWRADTPIVRLMSPWWGWISAISMSHRSLKSAPSSNIYSGSMTQDYTCTANPEKWESDWEDSERKYWSFIKMYDRVFVILQSTHQILVLTHNKTNTNGCQWYQLGLSI